MEQKLVFAVNGKRFELSKLDPSITLLEFLRTQTRFRGPKRGCGEGGCGACVVLMSTYDPIKDQVKEFSVSSCLTLLCSINYCSITTSEGLGNSKDGFHSIHKRFAGFHASQCGFCTPGMCMSLFAALVNADNCDRPKPPAGFSKLTKSEAEKAIAGNLCRCTGYRPILDVCKSFAADIDLEDLGLNTFWRKGQKDAKVDKLPFHARGDICTYPDFLKSETKFSLDIYNNPRDIGFLNNCWYRPNSINEVYSLLYAEGIESKSCVKMVVGNTGSGVYKEHELYDKYIDLKGVPELLLIDKHVGGISFGAAVTISRAIEVLKETNQGTGHSGEQLVFSKIADHMNKIASSFVRNTASLGGNLMMAQRSQLPSDIATILLAVGATVCLQTSSERLLLTLEEFFDRPPCDNRTLLISIHIPHHESVGKLYSGNNGFSNSGLEKVSDVLFETYRAAPRPLGNAVAYLNCAFLAQVSLNKVSGDILVDNVRLAFGAYGCEHAIRARNVEKLLVSKALTPSLLLESIMLLKDSIVPKEGTPHAKYRISLAVAFLFKFLQPLVIGSVKLGKHPYEDTSKVAEAVECANGNANGHDDSLGVDASITERLDQMYDLNFVLSSKQVIEFTRDYYPVGDQVKKSGAEIQASGEALYVDDIPSPKDCLYGAFVCSTKPLAHIKGVKLNSPPASEKVMPFITVGDIPKGGQNIGSNSIFGPEPLFATSITEYAGQPLGVVIAETQRLADIGAKQAVVDYSTEGLQPPILTVEDAVRRSSYFEVPPMFCPENVGDLAEGMAKADHKIDAEVKLGSQYYFYLETQTALVIPDEDNCITVYSSTQCPETAHGVIAKCLGLPEHNVRVISRRVGGGFGGKALRAMPVAAACAIAAFKFRRPVRMYVDRKTDMVMAGGRHPMKINYSVGFKSNGKITALHIDILINAGISKDISPIMPYNMMGTLKTYNWGALSVDIKVCKTNLSTKSAMRAPGKLQASYIAEAVIEHVASFLSMDASTVRRMNLHTYDSLGLFYEGIAGEEAEYTLPSIVDKLVSSTDYINRFKSISHFNQWNKWIKRGISCAPTIYTVMLRPTPGKVSILNDGSVVVEVGGIEIGQGLWTKVKQMAAFSLAILWNDKSENLLDRVRVIQADTLSLIQGGWTAGSTTSESSCEAVRLACNILVDRLKPLKVSLEKQMGSLTWDALIGQASMQAVNLSASIYWVPDMTSMCYLNFGAAVSEVEVDILTGATTILQTDIIYDCGQSLNPAVDLGQIEGAFIQGIGFFMYEEYLTNSDGLVVSDGTWTYKIPTIDTIPRRFNVEILNSGHHEKRVLSSKASGEPPLVLSVSVHCAIREAIRAARMDFSSIISWNGLPLVFQLDVPATMPVVKELCGHDIVEKYLENLVSTSSR